MHPTPELLLDYRRPNPKVSIILIDWGVRESFHSLHYLNRQTVGRDDYELIWLEFYDHKPEALRRTALDAGTDAPLLDRWLTLGYPRDLLFHKHRLYNAGVLLARGDVCVICDSDAMFTPTFIEKIVQAFAGRPNSVVHLDEVRNTNPAFYPFNHPTVGQVLGEGVINWRGHTTLGLDDSPDMIHHANYGACMAAWRKDLLAVGGADEHLDYLGYVCGPYELTFRLAHYGREEHWLRDEYLYHTWHPNQYGWNTDYHGPHDGAHMALLALDARASFRTRPVLANPWVSRLGRGRPVEPDALLRAVRGRPEPGWRASAAPALPTDRVYWVERDYFGFDVFHHAGGWFGLPTGSGVFSPEKLGRGGYRACWQADSQPGLRDLLPVDPAAWERRRDHAPWPARMWRKLGERPLHHLPARLARRARRLVARP
jgi:hypothetical protein